VRTPRGTELAAFAALYRAKSISNLVLITAEWLYVSGRLSGTQSFTAGQINDLLEEAQLAHTKSAGVYLATRGFVALLPGEYRLYLARTVRQIGRA
jgi:hypothetical protein